MQAIKDGMSWRYLCARIRGLSQQAVWPQVVNYVPPRQVDGVNLDDLIDRM